MCLLELDPSSYSVSSSHTPIENLRPKQLRFVEEYVKDFNGAQAAIRAGYSQKTAKEQAARLLTKVNVYKAIEERQKKVAERAMVDATWIRSKLKTNLERAMQAEPVLDAEGNAIGVYRYNGTVANRALELLGKDLGMFTDRLEVSLSRDSRQLVQDLAKLAITCCDESKRTILLNGLKELEDKYGSGPI